MKPLSLELQGFVGVRDGLGKDRIFLDLTTIPADAKLVALVAPNGTGKSTIIDNLQPYRLMPSRSTTLGPGGFSYWDHIHGATAEKQLIWEHAGKRYRTSLTFKISGKSKKADCYLFQWDEAFAKWTPVQLADGTLSDGKSETYDLCVEGVLCNPELFFTSQFSAQSRKPITEYGNSKIKGLLASILDLHEYRELAAKASQVGKYLRLQLDQLQDEISQSRAADSGILEQQQAMSLLTASTTEQSDAEKACLLALDETRKNVSLLEAKRDSISKDEEQRNFLTTQISRAIVTAEQAKLQTAEQANTTLNRFNQEQSEANQALVTEKESLKRAAMESIRLNALLCKRPAIADAKVALANAQESIKAIDIKLIAEHAKLTGMESTRQQHSTSLQNLSTFQSNGIAKADIVEKLTETAALIDTVPCKGTGYQTKCPLLAHANEAKSGIQQHTVVLQDMRLKYSAEKATIEKLNNSLEAYAAAEKEIKELNNQRNIASDVIQSLSKLVADEALLDEAERRLPEVKAEGTRLGTLIEEKEKLITSFAEKIATVKAEQDGAVNEIESNLKSVTDELKQRLDLLAAPVTEAEIDLARNAVRLKTSELEQIRTTMQATANQRVSILARIEALESIKLKAMQTIAVADDLSDEIAKWKLIEKGMGNDGLIALSIDDAGPEISSICNRLLDECYSGRFSVRLDTQSQTQSGNVRETFDVKVMDNHRGVDEKSLGVMSGGERVWVHECLTRAIALYVGQSNPVKLDTLFSDESDGPLDPDKKRQYIQMKRAVLAIGGYHREYFISQTEELWQSADHRIEVACL